MSEDRFSLLQYFILSKLCQAKDGCIHRNTIYKEFLGTETKSKRAVLCRSLKRMRERGFIRCNMRHLPRIWLNKE